MILFEKKDDVTPLCPHCKKELSTVWYRELKGDLGKRCVYFCPKCKACLGVSQRKGLTMGL
jgi:Zn-finger nucleic acid-binding protein